MATKTRNHVRRNRRGYSRRIAKVVAESWLLVLASHTLATIVVLAVERVLRLPTR